MSICVCNLVELSLKVFINDLNYFCFDHLLPQALFSSELFACIDDSTYFYVLHFLKFYELFDLVKS